MAKGNELIESAVNERVKTTIASTVRYAEPVKKIIKIVIPLTAQLTQKDF